MPKLQVCTFCDLFGFNSKKNPISRLSIKINSTVYPNGFEFERGIKYENIDIYEHINDLVLIYHDGKNNITLHMFIPEGTSKSKFINVQPEDAIYRYGNYKYLNDAYENGRFLVFPALEYIRNEYGSARGDNEIIHRKNAKPETVEILTKDKKIIKPIGDVIFSEIHLPVESYILCFSYANDDGLYEEFEGSDACLIIHDMNEFTKRIHIAFNKEMPNHIGRNGRVNYGSQLSPFGVLFTKPLDYVYQREYRFSWIPEQPKQFIDLNHIMNKNQEKIRKIIPKPIVITLGSIKDISSIKMKP